MSATSDRLESAAAEAEARATECSQRGDTEGSFYARGLRDAFRTAAAFYDDEATS